MIDYGHGIIGYILTVFSVIFALITVATSLLVILTIVYHLHQHGPYLKREEKINLVISSHIYLFILIFALVSVSANSYTLIGDIYGKNFDSAWCIFQGYCFFLSAWILYHEFLMQTIFRLLRLVHPNYLCLQSHRVISLITPFVVLLGVAALSPLLLRRDLIYSSREHYCCVLYTNIFGILWTVFACYLVPLIGLFLVHIRITIFLRQQPSNLAIAVQQRQRRDLAIIQRIFFNVGALGAIGFPTTMFVLMALFNGVEHPLAKRISMVTTEISFTMLSVVTIFTTPQLKKIIINREQQRPSAISLRYSRNRSGHERSMT